MQLKKYYMIECVLCFIRLPCISFVHTPCLPCICSFCSFALYLFVRPIFVRLIISLLSLCLFTRLLTLFVESLVPFFFFFLTRFLSLSLTHSFLFSFILFVSVTRSLSPFLTHSFVFSCILWFPRSFVQIFAVNISLYLSSFFLLLLILFLVTHGSFPFLLVCWHAFSFATPSLFGFLSPSPLPYPLPLKFFLSFCPLLSSYLLFFSCWTRKGTYHISILQKDVLLKKFFFKLFIRHTSSTGLLFVFFYLIFTVGGKKLCIGDHFHSWLKSWLAQTTHTPTPWFNRFPFLFRVELAKERITFQSFKRMFYWKNFFLNCLFVIRRPRDCFSCFFISSLL